MVREYTYDEPVFRRAYEVTEFSVAATASMPEQSFEERDDNDRAEQHP